MRRDGLPLLLLALVTVTSLAACEDADPVSPPRNRAPVIHSLTVYPAEITPLDSVTVSCTASDPDGDTLVYDWITDGRLTISGAFPGDHSLYNTFENSRVFYPNAVREPVDTPWVQSIARDRRGRSTGAVVRFIVHQ